MRLIKRGTLFCAQVVTHDDDRRYYIRIEAAERTAAFLFALGVEFRHIGPDEDSGQAWYEFEYSDRLDTTLKQIVDVIGDIVFNQPAFGQLVLFDEEMLNV